MKAVSSGGGKGSLPAPVLVSVELRETAEPVGGLNGLVVTFGGGVGGA